MKPKNLTLILWACLILSLACFTGCAQRKNLEKAKKIYDRVNPGMSREDACWNFEVSCENVKSDYTYSRDVGKSFSGDEYVVTIYIKNDVLARVDLVKPFYKYWGFGPRNSDFDKADLIEEKGISYKAVYERDEEE